MYGMQEIKKYSVLQLAGVNVLKGLVGRQEPGEISKTLQYVEP